MKQKVSKLTGCCTELFKSIMNDEEQLSPQNQSTSTLNRWPAIEAVVSEVLTPVGFEAHPFHIGWYNELVGPRFYLDFPENTLALAILSGPDTFEKCIIPFVQSQTPEFLEHPTFDPLDGSMRHVFQKLTQEFTEKNYDVLVIQDFELYPNRKPKVLVQTAAHVAGAVEYFHRDRMTNNSPLWLNASKLFGVAIHPEHGGWFAIRGVIVFKNLVPDTTNVLPKPPRPLPAVEESEIIYLLEQFGTNWTTHTWRDVLPRKTDSKYSQYFIDYLGTEPPKRWEFIKNLPFFQSTMCHGNHQNNSNS